MGTSQALVYRFDAYRLEPAERRLWRAAEPVPLQPKLFDALHLLVRNAGSLVTKDDFLAQLWPGAVVEEGNIASYIARLRGVLAEAGAEVPAGGYIQTIPRWGYRFVGQVLQAPGAETGGSTIHAAPKRPRPARAWQECLSRPARRAASHPEGVHACTEARYRLGLGTPPDLRLALTGFQRAVHLDARLASAYAGLAECYTTLSMWQMVGREHALELASAACEQALSIEPEGAAALAAQSAVRGWFFWDLDQAAALARRAVSAAPAWAPAWHRQALVALWCNQPAAALQAMQQALLLDPFCRLYAVSLPRFMLVAGDPAACLREVRRQAALYPADPQLLAVAVSAHLLRGETAAALRCAEGLLALPDRPVEANAACAAALAAAGRGAEAHRLLARSHRRWADADAPGMPPVLAPAVMHTWLQDPAAALQGLEAGLTQRAGGLLHLRTEPLLRPLHREPRFARLAAQLPGAAAADASR